MPEKRLEDAVELLLVNFQLEQLARACRPRRRAPAAKPRCAASASSYGEQSLADMPALLRPHSNGNTGSLLDPLDQFRRRHCARSSQNFSRGFRCVLNSARTKRGKRHLERGEPDSGRTDGVQQNARAVRHAAALGFSRDSVGTRELRYRPWSPARPHRACPYRKRSRPARCDSRAASRSRPPAR